MSDLAVDRFYTVFPLSSKHKAKKIPAKAINLVYSDESRYCAYVENRTVSLTLRDTILDLYCDCKASEDMPCEHSYALMSYLDDSKDNELLLNPKIRGVWRGGEEQFIDSPQVIIKDLQQYTDKDLSLGNEVDIEEAKKLKKNYLKQEKTVKDFIKDISHFSSDKVDHEQALIDSFRSTNQLAFRITIEKNGGDSVMIEPYYKKEGGAVDSKGKELTRQDFLDDIASNPNLAILMTGYSKEWRGEYYESNTYEGKKYSTYLKAKDFADLAPILMEYPTILQEGSSYRTSFVGLFNFNDKEVAKAEFSLNKRQGKYSFISKVKLGEKVLSPSKIQQMNSAGLFYENTFIPFKITRAELDLQYYLSQYDLKGLSEQNAQHLISELLVIKPELIDVIDSSVLKNVTFIKETPSKEVHFLQPNGSRKIEAKIFFNYSKGKAQELNKGKKTFSNTKSQKLFRDLDYEKSSLGDLATAGCTYTKSSGEITVTKKNFAPALKSLSMNGWTVKAEGKIYRSLGKFNFSVSSGLDWFDVKAEAKLDNGEIINISDVISKVKKGDKLVTFNDGSVGFIDDKTINKLVNFLNLGEKKEDSIRFKGSQTLILDALLAEQKVEDVDNKFQEAREKLCDFKDFESQKVPRTFKGKLRPYQQEGYDWLRFCREFNLGACLADDMGLGKTIQILALLEDRRVAFKSKKTSIVVVPTSLIFNWQNEVEKFAPKLKVLVHTGTQRQKNSEGFEKYDLVLTTYGLMRNDAKFLKDFRFDYAILDEAQAIKNSGTANAKGSRLLNAEHKVIMSGTPIENHLGELWSLFEFINPGMLGRSKAFERFSMNDNDGESLKALSAAISPMIMRRTKALVADDLPDKTEQHLVCEMLPEQKEVYEKFRKAYVQSMEGGEESLLDNKMETLEALLRLRQIACHPALVDDKYKNLESAKLNLMLEQIEEVMDENHKVLIFSQFTSLLSIVKKAFDKKKLKYEYLDGRTRKREDRVKNFQENPDVKAFIISLKAGGTGLNLTAAEYVYILDPWWNPGVEAQAVDRAYRIGQKNHVFAYKMIAKDSVEEKIMELQKSKKDLADAVIQDDGVGLKTMSSEDLKFLFS